MADTNHQNGWSWAAIVFSTLGIVLSVLLIFGELWASVQIYNLADTLYTPINNTYSKTDEILNNVSNRVTNFQNKVATTPVGEAGQAKLVETTAFLLGVTNDLSTQTDALIKGVDNTISKVDEANGKIEAVNTLTGKNIPTFTGVNLQNLSSQLTSMSQDLDQTKTELSQPTETLITQIKTRLINASVKVNSQVAVYKDKVATLQQQTTDTKKLVQNYVIIASIVMLIFFAYIIYALVDQIRMRYQAIQKNKK